MNKLIEIKKLVKTYNSGKSNEVRVLKELDFTVFEGEMIAVMGRSGAGKSTLLHVTGCIESYNSGQYLLDGKDISGINDNRMSEIRNSTFGIVKQDFALIEEYSVKENIALPLYVSGMKKSLRKEAVKKAAERTGIADLLNKEVRKLSGGQKQRTAIARAMVNSPRVLLADEPTGALDAETAGQIMELFKEINRSGQTVIIVTHDPQVAEQCERIIEISDGKIVV